MIKVNSGRPKYLYPANQTNRYVWSETIWFKEGANTINVTAYDYSNNSASKVISVDFKPLPTGAIPGAGAPALAAAVLAGFALLARRRRQT